MNAPSDQVWHGQSQTGLRLLATSDLHMHLTGWDYIRDRPAPSGGLARVATLIDAARRRAKARGWPVLLVDNGDGLQGAGLQKPAKGPHPLMAAFDALRYDSIGLGNHDFDDGVEVLEQILDAAPCPIVCTNLDGVTERTLPRIAASAILTVPFSHDGLDLRVGLLGVVPPQTMSWNGSRLSGRLDVGDMVETAGHEAADLRARGCDLVILLAHTGFGEENHVPGQENALAPLAGLGVFDAIIGGHSHLPFAGAVSGCPVVVPGPNGTHLAEIDLTLQRNAGNWAVTKAESGLQQADGGVAIQPGLRTLLSADHDHTRKRLSRRIGHTSQHLHSYFAAFRPGALARLVAEAQAAAVRPLLAGTRAEGLPVLAAVAPGRTGGRSGPTNFTNVPAGPVLERHLQDIVCFDNELRVVIVSRAQLEDWMEMAAGLFNQVEPGAEAAPLFNPDWPAHGSDTFFGLDYQIDLSRPARFSADGTLIDPDAGRIRPCSLLPELSAVVTTDYRVSDGGNVRCLRAAEPVEIPGIRLRDAVKAALQGASGTGNGSSPWRFRPLGGVRTRIPTAPEAAGILAEIGDLDPIVGELDCAGFLQVEISV